MKKLLLSLLSVTLMHAQLELHVIDQKGQPTAPLLSLLASLDIKHDGTLESIVAATQKEQPMGFLRAHGKERWQLETLYNQEQKALIFDHAQKLGMSNRIVPGRTEYDYGILMGATVSRVRTRLAYMVELWQSGIRWKKLVILTGQRPLDKDLESEQELCNPHNGSLAFKPDWQKTMSPLTEAGMIKMVIEQSQLPEEWKEMEVILVTAGMHADGSRPNRLDTIKAWFDTNPAPGAILSVSNQPYVSYDDATFRAELKDGFTLESAGHGQLESTTSEIVLDTIARWLYAVNNLIKK